jgi:hypothetical protein
MEPLANSIVGTPFPDEAPLPDEAPPVTKMWFSVRTKRVTRAEGVDALRGGLT